MPTAKQIAAGTMGAKVEISLYYGAVVQSPDATLTAADLQRAYEAGVRLADALA